MIDLNCDLGELEDAELEARLMEFITSANVACGAHAGDERSMERTVKLALERGVRIGAHPGYPDRARFGRVELEMAPEEIEAAVSAQLRRLDAIVQGLGGSLVHVKPHGALYHAAATRCEVAGAIGRAVLRWNPSAAVVGLAGSPTLAALRAMGLTAIGEGFADRIYESGGRLRPRSLAGALITDPEAAAAQAVRLAREGAVQTICVHSDTPGAVAIAQACRQALQAIS